MIPVHNEQRVLQASMRKLHDYLTKRFTFPFRDHDRRQRQHRRHSRDSRWRSRGSSRRCSVLRLERKGRGHALRAAWSRSEADILAYMDVDLSTDLAALAGAADSAAGWAGRYRDRLTAGAGRAGDARDQAGADLTRLQPAAGRAARRRVFRRPMRLQGRSPRGHPGAADGGTRTTRGSSTPSCSTAPSGAGWRSTRYPCVGSTTPTRAWTSSRPRARTCRASCACAGRSGQPAETAPSSGCA